MRCDIDMNNLDRLRQQLVSINQQAFQGLQFDLRPIQQEGKKLRDWLSSSHELQPAIDHIVEAILRFIRDGRFSNLRDARLVCRGAALLIDGQSKFRLIEDKDRFPRLLVCTDGFRGEPRKFRRCYHGLLSSYFGYDRESNDAKPEGRDNWERLRGYLNVRISDIDAEGVTPDWVTALYEHRNLLSEDRCGRYGRAFLEGQSEEFAEAEQRLAFSGASWIAREVVQAQIKAVISLGDNDFKQYIPALLKLVGEERHASLLDRGLALLLERYSTTNPLVVHAGLCNFAVAHWKNPWLDVNRSRWRLVSESARKMVADWLKLDFIKQFFELLSADGSNDTRRLDFWGRYHRRIDDMYFALGPYAANNRSPAFEDLRRKMTGRWLRLHGGGARENNAFIMTIGDYAFVEFGSAGNAAYVYRVSQGLPFVLTLNRNLSLAELKHRTNVGRWLHRDNTHGYDKWERRFDATLFLSFNIRASDEQLPESWRSGNWLSTRNVSNINAFCRAFHLRTDDQSSAGGYFWILTDTRNPTVNSQLTAWGFVFRPSKGLYR